MPLRGSLGLMSGLMGSARHAFFKGAWVPRWALRSRRCHRRATRRACTSPVST